MKSSLFPRLAGWFLVAGLVGCHQDVPPRATAAFSVENNNCEAPCEVRFAASAQHASSVLWDFGDGEFSKETAPRHTYRQPGQYRVVLRAVGEGGSQGTSQSVIIRKPEPPTADFTITGGGCVAPCWVNIAITARNATSYSLDKGDGSQVSVFSEEANKIITLQSQFQKAGTFTVTLTATGLGGTAKATRTVTINGLAPPEANFRLENAGCVVPCQVRYVNESRNATGYVWSTFFGGNLASRRTDESLAEFFVLAGNYTVNLEATGPGGSRSSQKNFAVVRPHAIAGRFRQDGFTNTISVRFLTNHVDIGDDIEVFSATAPGANPNGRYKRTAGNEYTYEGNNKISLVAINENTLTFRDPSGNWTFRRLP